MQRFLYRILCVLFLAPLFSLADTDGDRTDDHKDNCPLTFNRYQTDTNKDGLGDACSDFLFRGTRALWHDGVPQKIIKADLNSDGKIDWAFFDETPFFEYNLVIALNRGNGLVDATQTISLTSPAFDIIAADFSGDGIADLALSFPFENEIKLYNNNGEGGFGLTRSLFSASQPTNLKSADLENDGDIDLIALHQTEPTLVVFRNGRFVDFGIAELYPIEEPMSDILVADFFGGANPEILTTSEATNRIQFFDNETGPFLNPYEIIDSPAFDQIKIADLNHDELPDLILINTTRSLLTILMNDGEARFLESKTYSGLGRFFSEVRLGDFDGSGSTDIMIGYRSLNFLSLFLNRGDGRFAKAIHQETDHLTSYLSSLYQRDDDTYFWVGSITDEEPTSYYKITSASLELEKLNSFEFYQNIQSINQVDLNGDEVADPYFQARSTPFLFYQLSQPDGTFATQKISALPTEDSPLDFYPLDFDRDGDLDLAALNYDLGRIRLLKNDGRGNFVKGPQLITSGAPIDLVILDWDHNGYPDLAVINDFGGTLEIFENQRGIFRLAHTQPIPARPRVIQKADLNNDGWLDLIVTDRDENELLVFINQRGAGLEQSNYRLTAFIQSIEVGDFNHDGFLDIALIEFRGRELHLFTNNGSGVFDQQSLAIPGTVIDIGQQTLDPEGAPELFVLTTTDLIQINFLGDTRFAAENIFATEESYDSLEVFDLDGDNDLDFALVKNRPNPKISLLLKEASGFRILNQELNDFFVNYYFSDLNKDSKIDLVVQNQNASYIWYGYSSNENEYQLTKPIGYFGPGIEGSLHFFDSDGDGDNELVQFSRVANWLLVLENWLLD